MEIDIAWYGNFGKDAYLEFFLENTCLSWVRKTLTLQYMCILVGLSYFCSFVLKWFDLVKRILVKMAKTGHFCSARHPYA